MALWWLQLQRPGTDPTTDGASPAAQALLSSSGEPCSELSANTGGIGCLRMALPQVTAEICSFIPLL